MLREHNVNAWEMTGDCPLALMCQTDAEANDSDSSSDGGAPPALPPEAPTAVAAIQGVRVVDGGVKDELEFDHELLEAQQLWGDAAGSTWTESSVDPSPEFSVESMFQNIDGLASEFNNSGNFFSGPWEESASEWNLYSSESIPHGLQDFLEAEPNPWGFRYHEFGPAAQVDNPEFGAQEGYDARRNFEDLGLGMNGERVSWMAVGNPTVFQSHWVDVPSAPGPSNAVASTSAVQLPTNPTPALDSLNAGWNFPGWQCPHCAHPFSNQRRWGPVSQDMVCNPCGQYEMKRHRKRPLPGITGRRSVPPAARKRGPRSRRT
ncbi:hypothetical protein MKEN_00989900 [Mycena kentingensis (nom. inval.)]|nr:hypothetical protein MKEN_00989900 [Mycena kentingensis (nom. inval.)]